MEAFILFAAVLLVLYVAIRGGIQTFQRNWIAAIILLLFLTPFWLIWALAEMFMDKPVKEPITVNVVNKT